MAEKDQQTQTKPILSNRFRLKVYSQFKVYFEDDVSSISAVNDTGPFDILAQHHNFITLLNPCDLVIKTEGKQDFVISITRGIMQVKPGSVIVFLDV
jgi:F0F1-type ATP synthase epsilon subunit